MAVRMKLVLIVAAALAALGAAVALLWAPDAIGAALQLARSGGLDSAGLAALEAVLRAKIQPLLLMLGVSAITGCSTATAVIAGF
jgi:hypothetical protein